MNIPNPAAKGQTPTGTKDISGLKGIAGGNPNASGSTNKTPKGFGDGDA